MSLSFRRGTEIYICLPFWKEATGGQTQNSVKPSVRTEQGGSRTSLNAPGFMLLTLEPNVFYSEKSKPATPWRPSG